MLPPTPHASPAVCDAGMAIVRQDTQSAQLLNHLLTKTFTCAHSEPYPKAHHVYLLEPMVVVQSAALSVKNWCPSCPTITVLYHPPYSKGKCMQNIPQLVEDMNNCLHVAAAPFLPPSPYSLASPLAQHPSLRHQNFNRKPSNTCESLMG